MTDPRLRKDGTMYLKDAVVWADGAAILIEQGLPLRDDVAELHVAALATLWRRNRELEQALKAEHDRAEQLSMIAASIDLQLTAERQFKDQQLYGASHPADGM